MSKITLAEFLGWEEDAEYEYEGMIYKIIGTDLIVNVDGLYRWERVDDCYIKIHELGKLSEEGKKVEPKKYYLKHKYLREEGFNYLNLRINGTYSLNDVSETSAVKTEQFADSESAVKTQFTDREIEEIEASGFNLRNFEKVEVGDE